MTNYPCPICERVFSRRSSLRNHVKTHGNIVDRVLREISEDTRQEDAVPGEEQDFEKEEQDFEEEEQEFEEEEQEEVKEQEEVEFEEEEQEFEEENPEEEGSSHSSLSLDSEGQEESEDAVIISYLIYTAIDMYIDKID